MPRELQTRLEQALAASVVSVARVQGGGYAHALHYLVELADGRRVFAKAAVDAMTGEWLRTEQRVYDEVEGSFMPRLVAFLDEDPPILVLEDLSGAHWPPPWRPGDVEAVPAALDQLASTPPPNRLHRIDEGEVFELTEGWARVADDPEPFLALGVCSRSWLEASLPGLCAATKAAPLDGDAFLHLDVRSDNICLREGRALLVDWNLAGVGNALVDIAFWLPSLHAEGGPAPEELLPDGAAELAALIAGFFAVRAGLPPPPTAPRVRTVQLSQLRVALPWAARGLGLDPPG